MSDKYIALFSSMASGLIGLIGALGVLYLNNRHQRSTRKADLLRERGEELYSTSVEWLNSMFAHTMRRVLVMRGQISYNQCLDSDIEMDKRKKTPSVALRLGMLVHIYFPSTSAEYDAVTKLRDELNEIESTFKRQYTSGMTDGSQFAPLYIQTQQKVVDAGDAFLRQVLDEIRKIK